MGLDSTGQAFLARKVIQHHFQGIKDHKQLLHEALEKRDPSSSCQDLDSIVAHVNLDVKVTHPRTENPEAATLTKWL